MLSLLLALAAPTMCIDAVRFDGSLYSGVQLRRPLSLAGTLHGVRPACRDTVPSPPASDTPLALSRIAGVDPRVAVAIRGRPQVAYVVGGTFPQVPSFPLHRAVYDSARKPDECAGWTVGRPFSFVGRVREESLAFSMLQVRGARAERSYFVDARTRLGFPATRRLRAGTRVAVTAVTCRKGELHKVVARRISLR